jgi:glycosyltransferase involved in cell wall biosynthesis
VTPAVRVLFVSGTSVGGAARSTHELASALRERGHTVATLMRRDDARWRTELHRRAVNLRVKTAGSPVARPVDLLTRALGRRLRTDPVADPHAGHLAVRPENALRRRVRAFRPDVVVVNSIDLPAWRQIHGDLFGRVPLVLYIREETGLLHLSHSKLPPDLVLANADGHVQAARDLGHDARLVPSVVDCGTCQVESTRRVVLFVNPIPMQGVDVAIALARSRPDVPFAFVESWPLRESEWAELRAGVAECPNVELRRRVPDARTLLADASILLAPYRYPGRSRVIAEAQCNGIPVLASDRYGPKEAVGPGGLVCDPDGPVEAWTAALSAMWDDTVTYDRLAAAAWEHSRRPEMQPTAVAQACERALAEVVGTTTRERA